MLTIGSGLLLQAVAIAAIEPRPQNGDVVPMVPELCVMLVVYVSILGYGRYLS